MYRKVPAYLTATLCSLLLSIGDAESASNSKAAASNPKLETLLKSKLEGAEGIEVILSKVEIPPNSKLPKHWHPGEEFAYVLEGSVTLWQKGKVDIVVDRGDVAKVPLKQIHTAITGQDGVTLLVFRIHAEGKPERISAE